MTELLRLEYQDAVRMPWNVIPGIKLEAAQSLIPISAVYTPLKPLPNVPLIPYAPLRCRNCQWVLNPHCVVDFNTKIWICCSCLHDNHFPHHYRDISATNLPPELFTHSTTVEYDSTTAKPVVSRPIYLFMVDTYLVEEEIGYLKNALLRVLAMLPENCFVGLITFGTHVHVHKLEFGQIPDFYEFKGSEEVTKDQVLEQMGFFAKKPKPATGVTAGVRVGLSQESIERFLLPTSKCKFQLNSILEELQKDPWPVPADQRAARCTGTALSVAAYAFLVLAPELWHF